MKRSEILKVIEGLINLAKDPNNDYPSDVEAENLLANLEEIGMLPPSISTNASGWEVGKGMSSYVNEWEPEDA